MGNLQKSWKGKPTTNFFTNGHFSNGTGITQESGSNPTNTVIYFPNNPGDTQYVLQQNGSNAEYQINLTTELLASTTYCMSGWYANSLDHNGTETMFHSRAFSASGASIALGTGLFNVLETRIINGITWKYCYATITTPADYSNSFNWYLGYGSINTVGYRYYTNIQMEIGNFPSRFVNGTRTTTQAILDLTNNSTITATSPTYNSNGTFSFGGGTERLDISNTIGPISNNFSISAWVNSTNISATQNIVSMNGPYFMRISESKVRFNVLAGGTWLFQPGTTILSSNTWYYFTMVYNFNLSLWIGYINGVQEFSVSKTGTVSNTTFFGYVGYTPQVGEQSNFLGQIAVVQYYNRALSALEVQQNFNALRGRYGL
jgi:hypothetical protein